MMNFNGHMIQVFSQEYAYKRAIKYSFTDDIPKLKQNLELFFGECEEYSEGDAFPRKIWNMYPENIAIIIKADQQYMLQTCSNYRVGKLYENIEESKDEIQNFFEKHQGHVILLDNSMPTVTIFPDYTLLIAYTEKMNEYQKEVRKIREIYFKCKNFNRSLDLYKKEKSSFVPKEQIDFIYELTKSFIEEIRVTKPLANVSFEESIKETTIPLAHYEALSILFALFLYYYRENESLKSKNEPYSNITDSFNSFIAQHPEAINYYLKTAHLSEVDEARLMEDLTKLNLTKSSAAAIADEILA